jgi:hypothetical protein
MSNTRTTDPVTSHEAGASVKNITVTKSYILRILGKRGRTDTQLIEAYRNYKRAPFASESGIRSRRSELVADGFLLDTGARVVLASGRRSIVWGIAVGGKL